MGNLTLAIGTKIDRFGSERGTHHPERTVLFRKAQSIKNHQIKPPINYAKCTGKFVSAADATYNQRSLPPSNLDTNATAPDYPFNYHVYKVIKKFEVLGGPIAPWFGQPGLGTQFYIGYIGTVEKLIELQYIQRINKTTIKRGPGTPNPCG